MMAMEAKRESVVVVVRMDSRAAAHRHSSLSHARTPARANYY